MSQKPVADGLSPGGHPAFGRSLYFCPLANREATWKQQVWQEATFYTSNLTGNSQNARHSQAVNRGLITLKISLGFFGEETGVNNHFSRKYLDMSCFDSFLVWKMLVCLFVAVRDLHSLDLSGSFIQNDLRMIELSMCLAFRTHIGGELNTDGEKNLS